MHSRISLFIRSVYFTLVAFLDMPTHIHPTAPLLLLLLIIIIIMIIIKIVIIIIKIFKQGVHVT